MTQRVESSVRSSVTGITSLGLDHTSLLGNTISEIAWHKAGIMKRGVPCCVDPHQKPEALDVIWRRGEELGSRPVVVPGLQELQWPGGTPPRLGLYGEVQAHNASLAVALTSHFLAVSGTAPSASVVRGLERTEWPGRSQVIRMGSTQFYLDGAHTEESIISCRQWFSHLALETEDCRTKRVLIFNTTGDREVRWLLTPLAGLQLDLVIFCTNISRQSEVLDQQNYNTNYQIQLARCETHSKVWRELNTAVPSTTIPCYDEAILSLTAGRVKELDELQSGTILKISLSVGRGGEPSQVVLGEDGAVAALGEAGDDGSESGTSGGDGYSGGGGGGCSYNGQTKPGGDGGCDGGSGERGEGGYGGSGSSVDVSSFQFEKFQIR